MTEISLDIVPQRSALLSDHSTEIHALVRLRAPAMPAEKQHERKPLNLALVLDRSGSMSGPPLAEAKRCAAYIVDQLTPRDHLTVVVYDNIVNVVVPHQRVTDREAIKHRIAMVEEGGMTALFEGWNTGATALFRSELNHDRFSRVLLLSDGCANVGPCSAAEIAPLCADMAHHRVTTSTYGLGHHFNEDLMVEMARAGGGQSYYGESAEDLMEPFQEEFALLSALCATRITLSLTAPAGVNLEMLNDYPVRDDHSWVLPDLAYEGEVWALVKLTVPADLPVDPHTHLLKVLSAHASYRDIADDSSQQREAHLHLPRLPAEAWQAIPEEAAVTARQQELQVATLQRQAREAAMAGDWAAVDRLLITARKEARNNPWAEELISSIQRYARQRDIQRTAKEAMFSAQKLSRRMASVEEDASQIDFMAEACRPAYLRKKREMGKRLDR